MTETKYLAGKLKEYLFASEKLTADFIIAKTILDNLSNLPHLYLKEIAIEAQVAESTVTKFCRKLGYEGFKELRNDIILEENIESVENILFQTIKITDSEILIDTILAEEKKILLQAFDQFDTEKLALVAATIAAQQQGLILSPIYINESVTFFEEFLHRKQYNFYCLARSSDYAVIEECLKQQTAILIFSITGEWVQHNAAFIMRLKQQGHKFILFTCNEVDAYTDIDVVFHIGDEALLANQSTYIQNLYFKLLLLLIAIKTPMINQKNRS